MISTQYMSEIFRVSPTPSLIIKADAPHYTIIGANDAYLEVTKSTNEQIIGMKVFEAFPPNPDDPFYKEGVNKMVESLETVISSGITHTTDPIQYDIPIRGTSKFEIKFWQSKNIPILNEKGEVEQILHTVSDITEISIATLQLQATETKYKELIHSMDAIIWEADAETLQYTYVSPQAKYILGYDTEVWYEENFWLNHIHPNDRENVLTYSLSKLKERQSHTNEYRFFALDGKEVWVSDTVSINTADDGKIKLRGVMTDISVRKHAEKEALENHGKVRKILENNLDIICSIDVEGNFIEMSDTSESILGYTAEEIIGTPFLKYVHPDDKEASIQEAVKIQRGNFTSKFENRYIHKNGRTVNLMWSAKWDEDEKIIYGIAKDATHKKKIEEKLLFSEQRFKNLVQHGADLIAILDMKGNYTYLSLNSESILGIPSNELLGQNAFALMHKDDLDRVYSSFTKLGQGERIISDTFRYRNGNGTYQWMEAIAIDMIDNPAVGGIVVNTRDVTEKKHYLEWHEYVNKATNNTIYDWDIVEDEVQWGGFTEKIFTPSDLQNLSAKVWIEKIHPEDAEKIASSLQDIIASHSSSHWNAEYRILNTEGEYLDIIEDGFFIRNDAGEAIRMIGALRDITDRKRFETELKISNQRYSLVTQATSDAIWDWDLTSNSLYWGEGFQKIFGHNPEKLYNDIRSWNKLIHPKDYKRITNEIQYTIESNGSQWEGQYLFLKSTGEYVYVNDRGFVQRDAEGKAIRMVGAMQNVHQEREKEVEDSMKLSISKIFTKEVSLEASFVKTIKVLLKNTEAIYGEVWLTNLDQHTISLSAHYGKGTYTIDRDYLHVDLDSGLAGAVFNTKKPHLIENIETNDIFLRKNFAKQNSFKSVWANPIIFNDQLTGIILLYYKKHQNTDLIKTLSIDILNLLASEIQRKKAEMELNLFFDLSPDYLCIIGLNGNYIKVNQKFEREIGPITKNGSPLTYHEYTHPEDLINIDVAVKTLKAVKVAYNESRYKTKSGDYIWVGWDTAALYEQGFYFTIGKDITVRKQQEKALEESNSKLSETLESIQDGFFALDFNWNVTYWNREAERMLHTKREDILGKNIWESFPEALKLLFYKEYNRAMKDREIVNFEEFFPPLNLWFGVSAFPSDGGITVYFKDITERKNESQKLLQFKNVIENSQDEIAIISTVNDSIYLNPAYTDSLGYSVEKLQQQGGPQSAFANEDLAAEVFSTLLAGHYWKGDVELIRKDRKLSSYHISGGPIFDDENKLIAVFLIHTDISQRREIESKLRVLYGDIKQQAKVLTESQKEIDQFAYVASTDLQVPLIRINENLKSLEREYDSKAANNGTIYIQDALQHSAKMQYMISGLLEYTQAGKESGALEKVDLNDVLEETNKNLRQKILDNYAKIDIPKMPIIKGYRSDFIKIFEILIDNSLTLNQDKSLIKLDYSSSKTHWLFSVSDNGPGFDPSYSDKIFNLFHALDTGYVNSRNGMSLAIAKKIVEKYKGEIWVETDQNVGSTMHFTISKDIE